MEKKKLLQILENFANFSKSFSKSVYNPSSTTNPSNYPVFVYQRPNETNWWVAFKDIVLGQFTEKDEAIEFATVVAKTNNVDIHIYINGKTEEIIKV